MFEKLATDLFVQLAARLVPPLPSGGTDAEADEVMETSSTCAKQAIMSASAFMFEYADVEHVVAMADDNGDRLTGLGTE
jgi:hypothetical protein